MNALSFALTPHFARTIVAQVMSLLGRDVSLVDISGVAVASYDPSLVGKSLDGAKKAVQATEPVSLEKGQAVGFGLTHEGSGVGAVVIHVDPQQAKEFVPLTRSFIELLIDREATQTVVGSLDQLLWQFFHSVSDGERETLASEARLLGVDLTKPRFAVLFNVPAFSEKLSRTAQKTQAINRFKEKLGREVAALFPTSHDNTTTYFGTDRFLLLKDASRGDETLQLFRQKAAHMLRNLGEQLTAGVGSIYLGVSGLLTSFREAEAALRLGLKLQRPGRLYFVDDLGLDIIFSDVGSDKQIHLARRLLGPLLRQPDLLKTIKAYFAQDLNLTKAAAALHIHRNTLIYRLGKIKELIGLDPERFRDAVQLRNALTLLEMV